MHSAGTQWSSLPVPAIAQLQAEPARQSSSVVHNPTHLHYPVSVPQTASRPQSALVGYLDMRGNSNSIAGGCIGCRIGETIDGFTVDGEVP